MINSNSNLSVVLRQFNATPADVRGKIIRVGPHQVGTLIFRDDDGNLALSPAMQQIETLITERKPVAFFVDPLSELHTAEENDNVALRQIIARFRTFAINSIRN